MFIPPFCPYKACMYHTEGRHPMNWYCRFGYHDTDAFGRVQRYRCSACLRTFSTQTFAFNYYAKRCIDCEQIFRQLRSTAGIRDLARNLKISRPSVENRLFRMAHWALAVHCLARQSIHLQEDLAADGFEGYTVSKFYPHHLNILIGKESQYFYAMDFTTLRRKGTMTPKQRSRRDYLDSICRPDPKGIQKSMYRLAEELLQLYCSRRKPFITLFTDEHSAYPPGLHQHLCICWLLENNLLTHQSDKGTKKPGRSNTLFAVNYMDRQLRKDVVNYVRQTVNTARNVSCLLERLCVYRLNHNYIKPYRENSPKDGCTHGSLAGCSMTWMEKLLQRRWQKRPFFSLLPLTSGELGLWFRLYRTPLKRFPEYMPKYAWG